MSSTNAETWGLKWSWTLLRCFPSKIARPTTSWHGQSWTEGMQMVVSSHLGKNSTHGPQFLRHPFRKYKIQATRVQKESSRPIASQWEIQTLWAYFHWSADSTTAVAPTRATVDIPKMQRSKLCRPWEIFNLVKRFLGEKLIAIYFIIFLLPHGTV